MLDDNDTGSGAADDQDSNGGAGDESLPDSGKPGEKKDDVIPKSVAERFKKDMLKWKDQAKENERKLNEATEKLTEFQTKGANGDTDYKAVAERLKTEAAEAKAKAQRLQENFVYSSKYQAVYKELKSLGLRDDAERYLEYEDLKDLEFETTSKGRVNVIGAKEWAADWQERNKVLFETKRSPKVSGSDGRSSSNLQSETVTAAMVVDAERKAKKSGKPEDAIAYKEVLDKFQKLRARRA